ncbi:Uncharacterized protein Adt_17618 [Abeliophyllum distichum]|uniref:Uncharacterized protein n=1 Tax=Abeliophyllum distichum TaxID=126358 RepID=A0ABD1THG6_9LAMI
MINCNILGSERYSIDGSSSGGREAISSKSSSPQITSSASFPPCCSSLSEAPPPNHQQRRPWKLVPGKSTRPDGACRPGLVEVAYKARNSITIWGSGIGSGSLGCRGFESSVISP